MFPAPSAVPARVDLGKGDALLIVPPFITLRWPCLGVHVLQSYARRLGFEVRVLYANLHLAASIGIENYEAFTDSHKADHQIGEGERFFAQAAYGLPPFGSDGFIDPDKSELSASKCSEAYPDFKIADIRTLERRIILWADDIANLVASHDFKVVGCSTTFEQTAASIALLNRIKRLRPDIVTILGGANCEGIMAKGILSLSTSLDYVFSGECEVSFPDFLAQVRDGRLPKERIVKGNTCFEMDDMPLPDFAEFYHQHRLVLPGHSEDKSIPYISSKGCWWGEVHRCSFCGLNGESQEYRHKSAEKVISDLRELNERYPGYMVHMVDNVMPYEYFKTLIPRLERELPGIHLAYEVRPRLSLEKVAALKRAGINIQVGIESLSTPSLKLMRKGTTSRQNISLLRYARSVDLPVIWNIIHDIPGEQLEEFERLLSLIPLLHHLQPPSLMALLRIDRFSPYFADPEEHGLSNIRPIESYFAFLPENADINNIAYYFKADYKSASRDHPEAVERLKKEIGIWQGLWRLERMPPSLAVIWEGDDSFMLIDTRGLPGTEPVSSIGRDEARVALSSTKLKKGDRLLQWALERKVAVEVDSAFIPLATSSPDLIMELERGGRESIISCY